MSRGAVGRAVASRGRPMLVAPPGHGLLRLGDFAFSRRTYRLVLEPVIGDLRREHAAALAAGRVWKARWVRLRGTWAFWSAVVGLLPLSVVSWLLGRSR